MHHGVEESWNEEEEEKDEDEDHEDHRRLMSPMSGSSHSDNNDPSDAEFEEKEEDDHRHPMSPMSVSNSDHSDADSEFEEERENHPLQRGQHPSRPKHSKESLKRRIQKQLEEHSQIIRPSDTTFDCRRSKRNRVRPVNYWNGERPLYKRTITKDGIQSTLVGIASVKRIEPVRIRKRRALAMKKKKTELVGY